MTWAFGLDLKPATAKFVLVALADNADDEGRAFPSIQSLVAKTSLDRKTVIHALDQLECMQLVEDTGMRVGRTHQVKVYRLVGFVSNSTENGTHPENGTVPEIPSNSTVFPSKGSRKRDTEPSGNPKRTQRTRKVIPDEPPPSNLNVEAWHRWVQYREEIRKALKPASIPAAQRQLAAYGPDQEAVVEQSIANGYQGLFAVKGIPKPKEESRARGLKFLNP